MKVLDNVHSELNANIYYHVELRIIGAGVEISSIRVLNWLSLLTAELALQNKDIFTQ